MVTAPTKNPVTRTDEGKKRVKEEDKWKRLNSNILDIVVVSIPNSMLKTNRSKHLVQRILYQWWKHPLKCCFWNRDWIVSRASASPFRSHLLSRTFLCSVVCTQYSAHWSVHTVSIKFFPFVSLRLSVLSDKPIDCCSITFKLNHLVVLFHWTKFDMPKWFVSFHWTRDTHEHTWHANFSVHSTGSAFFTVRTRNNINMWMTHR